MAFSGNTKLASIIMGYNVRYIYQKSFSECPASTVYITAHVPPGTSDDTFSNYTGKLFLQGKAAIDAYHNANYCWNRFESYAMIEPSEIKYEGPENIIGKPGDTFQLTATLMPENVTLPQIFWRSTNPTIASVDANGLVTIHVDLDEVVTMAGEDVSNSCKIIAESLYANGPVLEVAVTSASAGVKETISDGISSEIDFSQPIKVYNLTGVNVATSIQSLAPGIYIVRQGNTVKKIALK